MVSSRSLYALWVGTSGLEGEASGCEEGNDAIRVGYWFDSAGTSAFAGCGHAAMKTLGSYVSNPSETASRLDEDEKGIISGQGRAAAGGSLRCT